jgi:hypothetical protein
MAIKKATGDIILWLDSDQSLSPGVVKECEDLISLGYSAIYIPEVIVADSFFGKIRAFERTFYTGTYIDVPKAVLRKKCPLFDENMSGPEDADFSQRISGLRATTKRVLYHNDDTPFLLYCRKKAYYTKSMRLYAKKWPQDKCLNLKYRCWDVFVEKGKWRKLLCHPVLSLGVLFLLIVRGIIYAKR